MERSDTRMERMDRVALLWAEITAATREFLRALAESDRHEDWNDEGFGSCAEWLAWRLGIDKNTANEKVRTARALEGLPQISEAMGRGELSYTKVRALTRAATPANEADLLAFARACSAAKLERVVRGYGTMGRLDEAKRERARHRLRCLSVFPDDDGMYAVRGRLTPEVGALLMRAIEAASGALFREEDEKARPDPKQRRADAIGLLAERALAAGFAGEAAPVSGSRAERYQVVLHVVEAETLAEDGEVAMSELEDGTRVSAETARRLSCDAGLHEVRHSRDGSVLDVGRKKRTIPGALRRALEARDRGCRFPGCGRRFTDGHHIVHWADGGETSLKNTLLLCRTHHTRVHEGGWRVCSDKDGENVVFFSPKGVPVFDVAEPVEGLAADPLAHLIARNRERGVEPDGLELARRYLGDEDVPWSLEARAVDAVDPWEEEAA